MTTYETRGVLADAYTPNQWRKMQRGEMQLLTHTVEVSEEGKAQRVLCARVALDSMADGNGGDITEKPRCSTCQRRDPRWQANGKE